MKRLFAAFLFCTIAFAQAPEKKLSFDAVSIKPGIRPNMIQRTFHYRVDDSTADLGGHPLHSLIQEAFGLPDDQIMQPDWTKDPVFDVHATLPGGAHKEQVPEMLQTMLGERFGLKFHREQKLIPVYALVLAKGGPKMKVATSDDKPYPSCNGSFHKVCEQETMDDFVFMLSGFARMKAIGSLDRPVVNETGLTARYDFVFDSGRVGNREGPASADDEIVSPIDAVQPLGLRLEPSKHTYDILVVDHVERTPTEN
jgi:uncharacterized protein (TIGR03435 family)